MSRFSERFGFSAPKVDLELEEMPSTLRAGLWDTTKSLYFSEIHSRYGGGFHEEFEIITFDIWFRFYRDSVDERPENPSDALKYIRDRFFDGGFVFVYEFVEFMASMKPPTSSGNSSQYRKYINKILERERSAFRFADKLLVQVSDDEHRVEVTRAITNPSSCAVREHIAAAALHYSNRVMPDYRNSIKESISAVEAAVSFVVGRKTHGIKPLQEVSDKYRIHPALRDGFEKIYSWTSDDSGIRHRLMDSSSVTQEDARYMLVACSAFANYLIALNTKHGGA